MLDEANLAQIWRLGRQRRAGDGDGAFVYFHTSLAIAFVASPWQATCRALTSLDVTFADFVLSLGAFSCPSSQHRSKLSSSVRDGLRRIRLRQG